MTSSELQPAATRARAALDAAAQQYEGFLRAYRTPTEIPRSVAGGVARLVPPDDWTSGFVAGSLWLLYEHTRHADFRRAAESFTAALAEQRHRTDTHDLGFVILCSFGNGYRLTENRDYLPVIRQAAESLSARFNAAVGALRSWDFGAWRFPVIIDNMMNLELLYRATELGAGQELTELATTHALTTRRDHVRADGSSYHLVDYDPTTGARIKQQTNQGLRDESAWARGQAWGLYGSTMTYRKTRDPRFLAQAQQIAEFYMRGAVPNGGNPAMPDDHVPYFDFDAAVDDSIPKLRDASAGAIATSALLELSTFVDAEPSARYRSFAERALTSLASPSYAAGPSQNGHFLLMHSVGNYPLRDELDVAINYADYYYLEALLRCSARG